MIKIHLESSFKLKDDEGFEIGASFDHQKNKMDVTAKGGGNFCFLPSDSKTIIAIGKLIVAAGELALNLELKNLEGK